MRASGWRRLRAAAASLAALNAAALVGLMALPLPPEALPIPAWAAPALLTGGGGEQPTATRGMAALDLILAQRLTRACEDRGEAPDARLPSEALRAASIAAGDDDPEALDELVAAYAEGFRALGLSLDGSPVAPAAEELP